MTTLTAGPGEIRPDTIYTLNQFKQITGWGAFKLRTARKRGLRVLYSGPIGNRDAFIKGADFVSYLESVSGGGAEA